MLDLFKSLFGASSSASGISAQELHALLKTKEKPVLLDVRQPDEHKQRNIPNSLLIPLGDLQRRMKELEKYKNKNIVVYCASGARSSSACRMLTEAGYSVRNLNGGMMMWH
ncbi:MAG: rhodanese-like domain-containing protein [Candidatus Kapaibacterium sp.]|nr:MAG: rhodanese-like domain-containing protein [Candidatus Kapabacteria bacterium]